MTNEVFECKKRVISMFGFHIFIRDPLNASHITMKQALMFIKDANIGSFSVIWDFLKQKIQNSFRSRPE